MMNRIFICRFCTILVALCCLPVCSVAQQDVVPADTLHAISPAVTDPLEPAPEPALQTARTAAPRQDFFETGQMTVPVAGFSPLRWDRTIGCFPEFYSPAFGGIWHLHEGFNASLNMSVCASFGRHRYAGAGLATGVSAMYARSLTDKLMLAAGGFFDSTTWGAYRDIRAGVNVLLGYHLTERVSLYAYGSKTLTPVVHTFCPMPPVLWADRFRECFGAMVHVKVSDAVSFSVSVEERRR